MGCAWLYCQYPCCLGQARYIIAVFALNAVVLAYCQRASLNIGMIAMVEHISHSITCPIKNNTSPMFLNVAGKYVHWTEEQQGYNLGFFFIGYLVSHIPAGILCDKYGPRYPLFVGMLLSTVSTALIPLGASTWPSQWWIVGVLRIVTGIGQGALFPGVTSLMARWIPTDERATIGALVFAAHGFGLVVGNVFTGLLIDFLANWPIAFYMWASVGGVYCLFYLLYAFSDPRTHPFIHPIEMDFLQEAMTFTQPAKIPILAIIKDKSIYGLIFVQWGHNLIMFTLANNLPKYLNQVLGLNLHDNALVSLIFLLQWLSGLISGILADYLVQKKNANVTFMRRLYSVISNMGSFCCLSAAVLFECRTVHVITSFGVALFFKGIFFAGGTVNIMDISINHAGLIMSIVRGLGSVMGFVCSYAIGVIAVDNSFSQWQIIIGGIGVVETVTLFLYILLTTAERSDWDYLEGETIPPKTKHAWYKQMSDSDHQFRLDKDRQVNETRKEAAKAAKAKLKEELQHKLERS